MNNDVVGLEVAIAMEKELLTRYNPRVISFQERTFTMNDKREVSRSNARKIIDFVKQYFADFERQHNIVPDKEDDESEPDVFLGFKPVIRGFVHPADEFKTNPRYSIRMSW